jgi:peptide/nickel transport system permease protein
MARGSFAYAARNCLHALAVILGVSLLTFAMAHAAGDPAPLPISPGASNAARPQGLGQNVLLQYLLFLRHALLGDFGQSFIYRQAVSTLVLQHLPATLLLAGSAFAVAIMLSVPLALAVASRGDGVASLLRIFAAIGLAIPCFWLGLMLTMMFSIRWRLLPQEGQGGLAHLALPAIALALPMTARLSRHIGPAMNNIMHADYMRTARAKGLSHHRTIWVHALRNLLPPVVAITAHEFAEILSLAVAVEVVFAWPGIGRLAATALGQHDFPLLQGLVFLTGLGVVVLNLLCHLLSARLDPRLRLA